MIEASIVAVLAAGSTDALVDGRIYPMELPQAAVLPAVVYQRIATEPLHTMEGDEGLDDVRLQFSCWATNYADAKALSAAVRADINASALKSRTTMELDDRDEETRHYRVILDLNLWQR